MGSNNVQSYTPQLYKNAYIDNDLTSFQQNENKLKLKIDNLENFILKIYSFCFIQLYLPNILINCSAYDKLHGLIYLFKTAFFSDS